MSHRPSSPPAAAGDLHPPWVGAAAAGLYAMFAGIGRVSAAVLYANLRRLGLASVAGHEPAMTIASRHGRSRHLAILARPLGGVRRRRHRRTRCTVGHRPTRTHRRNTPMVNDKRDHHCLRRTGRCGYCLLSPQAPPRQEPSHAAVRHPGLRRAARRGDRMDDCTVEDCGTAAADPSARRSHVQPMGPIVDRQMSEVPPVRQSAVVPRTSPRAWHRPGAWATGVVVVVMPAGFSWWPSGDLPPSDTPVAVAQGRGEGRRKVRCLLSLTSQVGSPPAVSARR